jgi:hypothetical protein
VLGFAADQFDRNGYVSNRQIIDISGDGPNNQGIPVTMARDAVLARGIVINGLPLMTREGFTNRYHLENLDEYYFHCVIGGLGSFVLPVLTWEEFPKAVRQKLVMELAGLTLPTPDNQFIQTSRTQSVRVIKVAGNPGDYDCLIGEKQWRLRQDLYSDP